MACARVCCILLGEMRLLKWHVPVCAVFSQGSRDCSTGMCLCVLYSPRGDEIAQMVCARVCCILLGKTRLLKWHVPVCAVFQGRRDCSNGMCPCVLYSPRGDEIAQMASACVYCILLGEISQMVCALVCCILLGETRLLKWYVPVCALFSQGRRDCSNGMCPCVLYSPRGDEIAQMACARVCCILGESRLLKWHVAVCAIFSQGRLLKWYVPLCAVFSQGRRDCSNGMCPCVLYSPRETRLLKWHVPVCAVFSYRRRDCSNGMCPCVLYSLRGDCSNGMCPCVLYSPIGDEIAQMACARVCCILLGEMRLLKWHMPVCAVFSQGRGNCSNGRCLCVLYSPRGDEIAQMVCAHVCCILLGETRLLHGHMPFEQSRLQQENTAHKGTCHLSNLL